MNTSKKSINYQDFKSTCSDAEIINIDNLMYKHVIMFGEKTLIYWKDSGRISTRNGHVNPAKAK